MLLIKITSLWYMSNELQYFRGKDTFILDYNLLISEC